jgi:lipoprotein-releasing system ATP-binding protein
MSNPTPVLSARGINKTYQSGPQPVTVLRDVSFDVFAGESVAIVGASGCGKSTLLHVLGGLDDATSGKTLWAGKDIATFPGSERDRVRNATLGFVYQFHHLIGELNATENVGLPLRVRRETEAVAKQRANELLDAMGLAARSHHLPSELSGGERQRVAIARALAGKPQCLLADEPTGNLDRENAERVFGALIDVCKTQNAALVLVTHAPELAQRCDRVFTLIDGVLTPVNPT